MKSYILVIKHKKGEELQIGKLGKFFFPEGIYIYVGSNPGRRIERHLRKEGKRLKWHIDFFLNSDNSEIIDIILTDKEECKLAQEILSKNIGEVVVRKFGSTDCNCITHFFKIKDPEDLYKLLE